MKLKRKLRRIFNLYNLLIVMCIIIMIGALYFIFKPEGNNEKTKQTSTSSMKIVNTNTKKNSTISEDDARKVAVKQFKELGETVSKEDLKVRVIMRGEDKYYYIKSKENTMEIKIVGGEITRINAAPVKEK